MAQNQAIRLVEASFSERFTVTSGVIAACCGGQLV